MEKIPCYKLNISLEKNNLIINDIIINNESERSPTMKEIIDILDLKRASIVNLNILLIGIVSLTLKSKKMLKDLFSNHNIKDVTIIFRELEFYERYFTINYTISFLTSLISKEKSIINFSLEISDDFFDSNKSLNQLITKKMCYNAFKSCLNCLTLKGTFSGLYKNIYLFLNDENLHLIKLSLINFSLKNLFENKLNMLCKADELYIKDCDLPFIFYMVEEHLPTLKASHVNLDLNICRINNPSDIILLMNKISLNTKLNKLAIEFELRSFPDYDNFISSIKCINFKDIENIDNIYMKVYFCFFTYISIIPRTKEINFSYSQTNLSEKDFKLDIKNIEDNAYDNNAVTNFSNSVEKLFKLLVVIKERDIRILSTYQNEIDIINFKKIFEFYYNKHFGRYSKDEKSILTLSNLNLSLKDYNICFILVLLMEYFNVSYDKIVLEGKKTFEIFYAELKSLSDQKMQVRNLEVILYPEEFIDINIINNLIELSKYLQDTQIICIIKFRDVYPNLDTLMLIRRKVRDISCSSLTIKIITQWYIEIHDCYKHSKDKLIYICEVPFSEKYYDLISMNQLNDQNNVNIRKYVIKLLPNFKTNTTRELENIIETMSLLKKHNYKYNNLYNVFINELNIIIKEEKDLTNSQINKALLNILEGIQSIYFDIHNWNSKFNQIKLIYEYNLKISKKVLKFYRKRFLNLSVFGESKWKLM